MANAKPTVLPVPMLDSRRCALGTIHISIVMFTVSTPSNCSDTVNRRVADVPGAKRGGGAAKREQRVGGAVPPGGGQAPGGEGGRADKTTQRPQRR